MRLILVLSKQSRLFLPLNLSSLYSQKTLKSEKAFTLIEVLVALLIFLVIALAFAQILIFYIRQDAILMSKEIALNLLESEMNQAISLDYYSLSSKNATFYFPLSYRNIEFNIERIVTPELNSKNIVLTIKWHMFGKDYFLNATTTRALP